MNNESTGSTQVADVKPLPSIKCGDEFINFVNNQLIAGELLHFSCELYNVRPE